MMKLSSLITTGIACLLALCFAALSAAYWLNELSDQSNLVRSVAVVGSVCISLMWSVCAYHIRTSAVLIVPVLVFLAADCYQNAQGYETFKGFNASADVTAAKVRLESARSDLANLPIPSATGAIRQASTWETVNAELKDRVAKAETDLKALEAPSAPFQYVTGAMAAIQLSLAIFFGCIGGRKPEPQEAKKPKNKDRSKAAKKGWETRRKKAPTQLKLVASNDA